LLLVLVVSLLASATALYGSGRLLRFGARSFRRAAVTAVILAVVSMIIRAAGAVAPPEAALPAAILTLVVFLIASVGMIAWMHRTTTYRAAGTLGIVIAVQVALLGAILFGLRPFVAEAYRMPTMAMAPTLVGEHWTRKCPYCGGPLLVEPAELRFAAIDGRARGSCLACGRESDVPVKSLLEAPTPADRFMVVKFLSPRRGDLVTFQQKGSLLVKRLVGMPGETITIDAAGKVLINGTATVINGGPTTYPWPEHYEEIGVNGGHADRAVTLGSDEYFFLGDNAAHSMDSRFSGPVKRADLDGVVSAIYWPLGRVRILR
jgi:signal peptidase I